jgi:hypothetical protein
MDVLVIGIVAMAAIVLIAFLWWRNRRRMSAQPQEWDEAATDDPGPRLGGAPVPQILDRNSLVNRSRVLDPSKWDNGSEGSGSGEPDEPGDLPRFFDRDYLRRQRADDPPAQE